MLDHVSLHVFQEYNTIILLSFYAGVVLVRVTLR